jgi:proteasome lid subunit RPN8/RPN11
VNDNRQPTDAENKPLILRPEHLAAIVGHARAAAPNECCGILAGRGNAVERVTPLANADASPTTFRVDPADLLAAFEALDAAGLDLVGIYHSHLASLFGVLVNINKNSYNDYFSVVI